MAIRGLLFGRPLPTERLYHERLTKAGGLAIFSSDALSSVAYATEEILIALWIAAGAAAFSHVFPIGIAFTLLLVIVATSYRQTCIAYPTGGGAYTVSRENLGITPALVAAAALMIDYVLTVAVSVSAGIAAITSAFPIISGHRVAMGIAAIALITWGNLRGVRESARIFAPPTYLFILSLGAAIAVAAYRKFIGHAGLAPMPAESLAAGTTMVALPLLLHAFSSGCAALTGTEAISNGIQAFKPPEGRNAATTMLWMALILGSLFMGVTVLSRAYHLVPSHTETILSQLGHLAFGRGWAYFLLQSATALILLLAANTSFADFPRLSRILAEDAYLPRQLANLGDRLVYANGITLLGLLSAALIVVFEGVTHRLIPLYAVGVYISFTLSQTGMVVHWIKTEGRKGIPHAVVNGVGAVATAIVLLVVGSSKFLHGAWIVIVALPLFMLLFHTIHRHYEAVARQLSTEGLVPPVRPLKSKTIILVPGVHRGVLQALAYAQSLGADIVAVHVGVDPQATTRLLEKWKEWGDDIPLVILHSPFRSLSDPIVEFVDRILEEEQLDLVTVVLPEFITAKRWHAALHNQSALRLEFLLRGKEKVVISNLRYRLTE